ncbi:MAG: hypothetical protein Q7R40_12350 [Phaeospirillum sp.]|nr:hypothetical protein [Phaeospirillum sp.]
MSRSPILANGAAILFGLAVALLPAELILRFLPVNTGLRTVTVNAGQPVFHFTPNLPFVYSNGWNLAMANEGRVNNAGFVNDQDYRPDGPPLLAVVGDSYVEALMVPYGQTLHGRLAAQAGDQARVYSFAASGAPLSQYLAFSRHATRDWGATALVIVVVGNDFDESLARIRVGPGFHHYVEGEDGDLALRLFDFTPNPLGRLAIQSALGRYLIFNLKIGELWRMAADQFQVIAPARAAAPSYVGNTLADADAVRIGQSERAVDAVFRDLPRWSGLPPERILFVMDGLRYPSHAGSDHGQSYFGRMKGYFMAQAKAQGYETIDVDPAFFAHAAAHPTDRFEFPQDAHWSSLAHGIVADLIRRSAFYGKVTGAPWDQSSLRPLSPSPRTNMPPP